MKSKGIGIYINLWYMPFWNNFSMDINENPLKYFLKNGGQKNIGMFTSLF